jgi:hypothetical protein
MDSLNPMSNSLTIQPTCRFRLRESLAIPALHLPFRLSHFRLYTLGPPSISKCVWRWRSSCKVRYELNSWVHPTVG